MAYNFNELHKPLLQDKAVIHKGEMIVKSIQTWNNI